ncbi:MAG: CHAD domain-containing protein [Candidatus Omnitrophica bacterium]|nr:CHAD domain-containing protein [Candidatus Omnitrophota bacterium]
MSGFLRREELELKLDADEKAFEALLSLLENDYQFKQGVRREEQIRDIYLDTRDWWFYRAGAALRVRQSKSGLQIFLKALTEAKSGVAQRAEIEEVQAPIRKVLNTLPPGAIRAYLKQCGAPLRLKPLFRIQTQRTCATARRGEDHELALSIDHTRIFRLNGKRPVLTDTFREVEIEHWNGPVHVTETILRELCEKTSIPASAGSKFNRSLQALELKPPAPAVPLRPTARHQDRLIDLAYRVLAAHFQFMRANEPGARLGLDPEFVHDMRVAIRRMRAAWVTFGDALPASKVISFDNTLKWIAEALGRVRDYDNHLEMISRYLYTAQEDGDAVGQYQARLMEKREIVRQEMLEVLDSARYQSFLANLTAFLEQGPAQRPRAPLACTPASEAAVKLLEGQYNKVLRWGKKALQNGNPGDWHKLRLACKQLRYTSEWFSGIYGKGFDKFILRLSSLQTLLGNHRDTHLAAELLRKSAFDTDAKEPTSPELLLAFGRMIEQQHRKIQSLEAKLPAQWKRFQSKKAPFTSPRKSKAFR